MGPRSVTPRRSGVSGLSLGGAVLSLLLTAGAAWAQTLPPGALDQLDHLIGSRVETFSVLDTQSGVAGGTYVSKVNDTDLAITRVTGRGDVARKQPLGDTGIFWAPMVEGGIGYGTFENHFDDGALDGNKIMVEAWPCFSAGASGSRSGRISAWPRRSASSTPTATTTSTRATTSAGRRC